jgi:hypothetical protein
MSGTRNSCQIYSKIWIFSTDFRKTLKYQISWKTFQGEPNTSMRTDGRTDRHDLSNSRSFNFVKAPINSLRSDSCVNVTCKSSVRTSQRTPSVTIIKISRQIVLREIKIFILKFIQKYRVAKLKAPSCYCTCSYRWALKGYKCAWNLDYIRSKLVAKYGVGALGENRGNLQVA